MLIAPGSYLGGERPKASVTDNNNQWNSKGVRIHFTLSYDTFLGYTGGQHYDDGVSYLEAVDFIIAHGARTVDDLKELW